ncbi:MAG: MaoC/PaaZ C-terminal domain-containing protein [Acidimicrobiales bacterium]
MPVPSSVVGLQTTPITHHIDARWLMAYASGLGLEDPRYFDTASPTALAAHPLFPVCVEWPTVLALRDLAPLAAGVTTAEARRGIHATHDLTVVRPMVPGDEVTTVATITGVEQRPPGAYLTMELATTDASGALVCTTVQGSLYLSTDVDGPDRPAPPTDPLPEPLKVPAETETGTGTEAGAGAVVGTQHVVVAVAKGDAHVYTECARIWNPIHTDRSVALAAGLPDIILHGTATLAHAVSVGVTQLAGGDPSRIRRIRGRFSAMVNLPDTITVQLAPNGQFEVRNHAGHTAITGGHLHVV